MPSPSQGTTESPDPSILHTVTAKWVLSLSDARRLSVHAQRLAMPKPKPTLSGIKDVARSLRCIQIDPTNAVARTQLLVLRSRVGTFDRALFERLMWKDRFFFHYFAHAASLVLTEDYPIHRFHMRTSYLPGTPRGKRVLGWMDANAGLRSEVLRSLKKGPMRLRDFEDRATVSWTSGGWNDDRNVQRMLDFLWIMGKVMIVGREGQERIWGLSKDWFPDWTPKKTMTQDQTVRAAAELSLKALGVATSRHLRVHFTRYSYPELPTVLRSLLKTGVIVEVGVQGADGELPGPWFIHRDLLPALEKLGDNWEGRTTLLSPFDNLICDRDRTELLFDFHYRIEIYVPKAKRQYGYFTLPILHGDRLIGRVDSMMDRTRGVLAVNSVYAEPKAPGDAGEAVAGAIAELADFVSDGVFEVRRAGIPKPWKQAFA